MYSFLIEKLRGLSLLDLIRLQIETLIWSLVSWVPTVVGFFSRSIYVKIFFRKSHGMQWIQNGVHFVHPNNIEIGSNVGINSNTYINGIGGVKIGSYVNIGNNVTLSSGRHPIGGREVEMYRRPSEPLEIVIMDDVWIGAGVVVMPGVTIGKGSVIGANSVVTKDTLEYSINVGAPSRVIGFR